MTDRPLRFHVAPHIVQDLGLNLYTTLSRVLVEFVANAHDADSPSVDISLDANQIQGAREIVKTQWELELAERKAKGLGTEGMIPLEERTLPADVQIIVSDLGHGMSRNDLQDKFLFIGRRRRQQENTSRSPKGRILMGRKGLGKLAGFGVAHHVVITSRKQEESHATQITLNYDKLVDESRAQDVKVPAKTLHDGAGLEPHGTRVVMSELVYESVKQKEGTINNAVGDHFSIISPKEFLIKLNGNAVEPSPREFVFAYPVSDTLKHTDTVDHALHTSDGSEVTFRYRIRFTGAGKQLDAKERGVRVYAHNRLAAVPDLLDLKTGVHGVQNIHYLDGIVIADFIDDSPTDYIATDRQTLRWETALLSRLRAFLTSEMQSAIEAYQKTKDVRLKGIVESDPFTKDTIEKARLPAHRKRTANKIAVTLASSLGDETADPFYKKAFPILVRGLGHGDILTSLSVLAAEDLPDFRKLIHEVTRLTAQEFDEFATVVSGRLEAIEALKRLYERVDFKQGNNEKQLHNLLKKNAWLIDPTFTQFLTSDQTENEMNKRLSKFLQIGDALPPSYNPNTSTETKPLGQNRRPDLVFLLSNAGLRRLVIVELKAPNTPLHSGHLDQLEKYLLRAEKWLEDQGGYKADIKVEGYLIGSKAEPSERGEQVELLRARIKKNPDNSNWHVFDIGDVLDRTKIAHQHLLDVYNKATRRSKQGVPI